MTWGKLAVVGMVARLGGRVVVGLMVAMDQEPGEGEMGLEGEKDLEGEMGLGVGMGLEETGLVEEMELEVEMGLEGKGKRYPQLIFYLIQKGLYLEEIHFLHVPWSLEHFVYGCKSLAFWQA